MSTTPLAAVSWPYYISVDEVDDLLTVCITLPGRWMVSVNRQQQDPDQPFILDDARQLTEAAFAAAWALL